MCVNQFQMVYRGFELGNYARVEDDEDGVVVLILPHIEIPRVQVAMHKVVHKEHFEERIERMPRKRLALLLILAKVLCGCRKV